MDNKDIWGLTKKYISPINDIILDNAKYYLHLKLATPEEDMKNSTDLIGELKVKLAIRVRDPRWDGKISRDLTIRAQAKYGGRTELDKLRSGEFLADYYFYFWGDGQSGILDWILVDMNKFKEKGLQDLEKPIIPNGDGTGFVAYKIDQLKESSCLVAGTL